MLEIIIDNCHKCDLETVNNPNNSQYFQINSRDLEIESKCNWKAIFDKCKDSSTQKYRKKITPNITFQHNKIFARNDLFEKIIKSCKATNLEFLKLKYKLGFCLYEDICHEQELISMSEDIFKEENIFTQYDVENKQSNKENEKSKKEQNEKLKEEDEQLRKNNVVKDSEIEESLEKPKERKSPEEDKNRTDSYPNWFDKNKFKNILAIIDSNKFNYRHKIIKEPVPIPKKQQIKKDENKNILLEYMKEIDDKLFKKYSDGKDFNSFINEFDRATNEDDKEKVVDKLKGMGGFVNHDIEKNRNNEYSEYISKLIDIVNAIYYFLDEYSKN